MTEPKRNSTNGYSVYGAKFSILNDV